MYTYISYLGFYWQLIVKHTMFSNDILSLYDSCMTFVYYFLPYIEQHELDTFTTLTVLV